jgi:hypothetical protein
LLSKEYAESMFWYHPAAAAAAAEAEAAAAAEKLHLQGSPLFGMSSLQRSTSKARDFRSFEMHKNLCVVL